MKPPVTTKMDKQYPPVNDIQILQREQTTHPDGDTTMEEQYSLEEWLGMLEEAGYSLEEGSVEDETKAVKAALSAKGSEKTLGQGMADIKAALKRLQAARKAGKAAKANESYTLEEWMGMLEEAGYSLDERNMANKMAKNAFMASAGGAGSTAPAQVPGGGKPNDGQQDYRRALRNARQSTYNPAGFDNKGKSFGSADDSLAVKAKNQFVAQQRTTQTPPTAATSRPPLPGVVNPTTKAKIDASTAAAKAAGTSKPPVPPATRSGPPPVPPLPPKTTTRSGPPPVPPLPSKKPKLPPLPGRAVAEAINENTVSRLQSLAGIKPTE